MSDLSDLPARITALLEKYERYLRGGQPQVDDGHFIDFLFEIRDFLAALVTQTPRQAEDDGGVAETERRHSLNCREQEIQRTREAEALQVPATTDWAWQPADTAPYGTSVLAWLYLPKNPIASGIVIAQRPYVEKDEPETYGQYRLTVGCWWANGHYYPVGHVTHWQPLPGGPTPA